MKVKMLVSTLFDGNNYHVSSVYDPRLIILDPDRDEGVNRLSSFFEDGHLEQILSPWIDMFKGSSSGKYVNCPQAYVELPIDLWKCKFSKKACQIQAMVNTKDKEEFVNKCTATETQKEGIYTAIQDGKYSGFHHVPGRYLCVGCEVNPKIKNSFQYHYELEMQKVDELIDISDAEWIEIMSKDNSITRAFTYCSVCTDCAISFIEKYFSGQAEQFCKIEFNYTVR
ncbi:hypothetical protein ACN5W3_004472 [Vibrio parahaemolyticus]